MAINHRNNEHFMETKGKNNIEIEIKNVLDKLDSNQILSPEERIELKDHFLCEIEDLTKIGLRDEEALLVARKRFGALEEVNMEYQKVNPKYDFLRYGIIGVVLFCIVKILTILVSIVTEAFWMIYYQFDPAFVVSNIILDIPLRFILVIVFGVITVKIISKRKFDSLVSLWQFPIIYLLFEVVRRLFMFLFPISTFNGSVILTMKYLTNNSIVNYCLVAIIMIIASYKMYKLKVLKMKYV